MVVLLLPLLLTVAATRSTGAPVLDPSLYLLPGPPLASNEAPVWSQSVRVTRDADAHTKTVEPITTTTEKPESMETAATFWSSGRTTSARLGGLHIPLTFSLSGTYGSGAGSGYGSGVISSGYGTGLLGYGASVAGTYASLSADDPGKYGKSALAGSSYGSYGGYPGIRLFGGSNRPGWSGWGNGKWGHYGKG